MANMCTKFEVSRLSCSRDILRGLNIYNWSCDFTIPFQGEFVIHRRGLAKVSLHNKFEISTLTHYDDMKGNAKSRNWVL